MIHVGKAGLFRIAGHTHEVVAPIHQGSAVVDPDHLESSSLELAFQAAALRVTGRGEPAGDVPKVQQAMVGPECLDASRFPSIRFASRRDREGPERGRVRRRGCGAISPCTACRARCRSPSTSWSARIRFRATGTTTLRQTAFGIKPISVAGVVNVKDELDIAWTVVARAPLPNPLPASRGEGT